MVFSRDRVDQTAVDKAKGTKPQLSVYCAVEAVEGLSLAAAEYTQIKKASSGRDEHEGRLPTKKCDVLLCSIDAC